jgi:hypothetical protein
MGNDRVAAGLHALACLLLVLGTRHSRRRGGSAHGRRSCPTDAAGAGGTRWREAWVWGEGARGSGRGARTSPAAA